MVMSLHSPGSRSEPGAGPSAERDKDAAGLDLVSKVGAVLEALVERGELTSAELATATGEPLSSIYRLVRSLTGIGWLDKGVRRGGYRLGLHFMTIGTALEDAIDIRDAALPALRRLAEQTGATSSLYVRRASRAVCVERIEGSAVRSLAVQLGNSLPLYAGAAPRALMAHLTAAERQIVLRDLVPQPGDPARPLPTAILADADANAELGYTRAQDDITPGIAALGAAVFDHRGDLAAAVSISGLHSQILDDAESNIRRIRYAAATVSRALGNNRTDLGGSFLEGSTW